MLDKIKFKNGLAWDCMNTDGTGFIAEEIETTRIIEDIFGLTNQTQKKSKQLAVYANQ